MKSAPEIKCILIDPFQCEVYPVKIRKDCASDMVKLLDCENLEAVNANIVHLGVQHVIWIDEEGLLRQPFVYPKFAIRPANGGHGIAGYGLITGMNEHGATCDCMLPMHAVVEVLGFEQWRARIKVDDVIDQMLRLYKLAL